MKTKLYLFFIAFALFGACEDSFEPGNMDKSKSSTDNLESTDINTKVVVPMKSYVIVTHGVPYTDEFSENFRFEYLGPNPGCSTKVKWILYKQSGFNSGDTIVVPYPHYVPVASSTATIPAGTDASAPILVDSPGSYKVVISSVTAPAIKHPDLYTTTFGVSSHYGGGGW